MTVPAAFARVQVIDSHTGGEPTRLVISGGPDLGDGPLAQRLARFAARFDDFRSAVVNEPRGSDVLVGALLCEPCDSSCAAGVIYFNNTGYLGMCGHGTIGLVASLGYAGRLGAGIHRIETPVGVVAAAWNADGSVSVENVVSYRTRRQICVHIEGHGSVRGDVAWGGNWFFIAEEHGFEISLSNIERLTELAWRIRRALARDGITGDDGHEIDHIELAAPADPAVADSKNFVLCPGGAYDRSPCGTGTSARLACLAADGQLAEGAVWRQQSIVGSVFEASYRAAEGGVRPTITGHAWISAEATLLFDPGDPFRCGIGR
ncbi:MAG TPA: 4-hydroxyproline epimerase [Bryobacteraceae bacterium]